MHKNCENLVGMVFTELTVVDMAEKRGKRGEVYWNCVCRCGNSACVSAVTLKSGKALSCGCRRARAASERMKTHGLSKTRVYKIWLKMKERCYKDYDVKYKRYGGRGIIICDEWLNDFMSFYIWSLSNGYTDNLTIDRIDNDGN